MPGWSIREQETQTFNPNVDWAKVMPGSIIRIGTAVHPDTHWFIFDSVRKNRDYVIIKYHELTQRYSSSPTVEHVGRYSPKQRLDHSHAQVHEELAVAPIGHMGGEVVNDISIISPKTLKFGKEILHMARRFEKSGEYVYSWHNEQGKFLKFRGDQRKSRNCWGFVYSVMRSTLQEHGLGLNLRSTNDSQEMLNILNSLVVEYPELFVKFDPSRQVPGDIKRRALPYEDMLETAPLSYQRIMGPQNLREIISSRDNVLNEINRLQGNLDRLVAENPNGFDVSKIMLAQLALVRSWNIRFPNTRKNKPKFCYEQPIVNLVDFYKHKLTPKTFEKLRKICPQDLHCSFISEKGLDDGFTYENKHHQKIEIKFLPEGGYSKAYIGSFLEDNVRNEPMLDEHNLRIPSVTPIIYYKKDGSIDRINTTPEMLKIVDTRRDIAHLQRQIGCTIDIANNSWFGWRRNNALMQLQVDILSKATKQQQLHKLKQARRQ